MTIKSLSAAEFLKSKKFKAILYGFAAAALALLIFQAGVFVGYHKAEFSYRWGDNYSRTFGGPGKSLFPGMPVSEFPNANGVIGKIISINLPEIVVEGMNKIEKVVLTDDDTSVRRFREEISLSDLKVSDYMVAIGSPDENGRINARLIRLIPKPAEALNISTTTQIK